VALEPLPPVRPVRFPLREKLPDIDVAKELGALILGQDGAIVTIAPYVELAMSGLTPPGRPAGVLLLLGPTGTGKTRTVEALAEVLHGSEKQVLRIDCGEFQLDHEVAKLIGAPPGYLGHRETHPMLSQQKLNAVTSERSPLSIVLFDEIEKAAPSFERILLGVLDRGALKLGDNTSVNFERSLIFLTSNLGAQGMAEELGGGFGFSAGRAPRAKERRSRLSRIGMGAVRRRFAPEFVNRIDDVITYAPLGSSALEGILDLQLKLIRDQVRDRIGSSGFSFELSDRARRFLLRDGTSAEYGARELKRSIHKHLMRPLAKLMLQRAINAGSGFLVDRSSRSEALEFTEVRRAA
jgi:ATP-dependent Clp protease ATP-binding subunit ClpA